MRKYLITLIAAAALIGAYTPPILAACGSTTKTSALGLTKIAGAKNWWECLDDNADTLDTELAVAYVTSTATAGGASTLTDTTQNWSTDLFKSQVVKITGGTGSGQSRSIASNTATVLTVSAAWTTTPDATSAYKIFGGLGGTFLRLSGGTMTGKITLDGDPTAALHAATKQYVDAGGGPVSLKVGTFTRDTSLATGTQAITGVGFPPVGVLLMGGQHNSDEYSWGADDGTTHAAFRRNASTDFVSIGTQSIYTRETGGNDYDGLVQSLDSDGFTISWTRTGTPTGTLTIIYMAFR